MVNDLTYWSLCLLASDLNDCAVPEKLRPTRDIYLLIPWKRVLLDKLS